MWDFTPKRAESSLPNRHDAVVSFTDSLGENHSFEYVLDWGATRNRMFVRTYGLHDGVKALQDMAEGLGKSS